MEESNPVAPGRARPAPAAAAASAGAARINATRAAESATFGPSFQECGTVQPRQWLPSSGRGCRSWHCCCCCCCCCSTPDNLRARSHRHRQEMPRSSTCRITSIMHRKLSTAATAVWRSRKAVDICAPVLSHAVDRVPYINHPIDVPWPRLLATFGFVIILLVALYCGTRKPSKWALEQQQLELQSLLSITDDSEYGVTDRVFAPAGAALVASNAGSSSTSHAWQIRSRQTAAASDEPAAVSGLTGGARSTSRYEFRMRALAGSGLPPPPPAPPRVVGSGLVVQQNIHRHPAGPVRTLPTSQLPSPPTMPPQQRRPEPVPHGLAGTPYGDVVITDLEDL